jgi:hypothetical protein
VLPDRLVSLLADGCFLRTHHSGPDQFRFPLQFGEDAASSGLVAATGGLDLPDPLSVAILGVVER